MPWGHEEELDSAPPRQFQLLIVTMDSEQVVSYCQPVYLHLVFMCYVSLSENRNTGMNCQLTMQIWMLVMHFSTT